MEVLDVIRDRRSVRAFKRRPVEEEKLNRVLEAARLAPSARNMQEWKFVVVRDKATRERLAEAANGQHFVGRAPVVIAACGTIVDHVMSCGQLSYPVDVAIAVTHMTLQAVAEGLGTCWVCAFDEGKVKSILNVPKAIRVVALLALGYPDESPRPRPRKDMSEIVAYERFD